jgi:hypothetical protein
MILENDSQFLRNRRWGGNTNLKIDGQDERMVSRSFSNQQISHAFALREMASSMRFAVS